jgi:regulator of sirC expression with transglutaminase-like and TPR domain
VAQDTVPDKPVETDQVNDDVRADPEVDIKKIVDIVRPALVSISSTDRDGKKHGIGTGFVISSDGLVVTNLHVIGENRRFSVEAGGDRNLPVTEIHATDRLFDLAIIKVDFGDADIKPLGLGRSRDATTGTSVVVMGNPLGWKNSVVSGIISGNREIDGRRMLQLALPIEPGNSGGPVVDRQGNVLGVVTMKSLVTNNLGFAIEVDALKKLKEQPNSIPYERWLTIDRMPASLWTTSGGADWRQRAGRIQVSGKGAGFAGRALCIAADDPPRFPYELAVQVRLDDEGGAAGLVFHSDGGDRHYGFYPSAGRMRFTAFQGPNVFSWRVLHDKATEHYRPGEWNELKVRVQEDRILCFTNGHLVFETTDSTFEKGKIGLAKFRDTSATFRQFQSGDKIDSPIVTAEQRATVLELADSIGDSPSMSEIDVQQLADAPDRNVDILAGRVSQLKKEVAQLESLAREVRLQGTLQKLKETIEKDELPLLYAAILLGKVDDEEVDVSAYREYVRQLAETVRARFPTGDEVTSKQKFEVLRKVVFAELGFHGSRHEYYHPANSHMHRVIDDREGLPISLSVFYITLAKDLGLQVEGIGLPGHFIVREVYSDDDGQYVDPFEGGKLLNDKDTERIVRENIGQPLDDVMLKPVGTTAILQRMTNNLISAAERRKDAPALRRYLELAVTLDTESSQHRGMRALARFQVSLREMALEDLQWFSDNQPEDVDLNRIEELRQYMMRQ